VGSRLPLWPKQLVLQELRAFFGAIELIDSTRSDGVVWDELFVASGAGGLNIRILVDYSRDGKVTHVHLAALLDISEEIYVKLEEKMNLGLARTRLVAGKIMISGFFSSRKWLKSKIRYLLETWVIELNSILEFIARDGERVSSLFSKVDEKRYSSLRDSQIGETLAHLRERIGDQKRYPINWKKFYSRNDAFGGFFSNRRNDSNRSEFRGSGPWKVVVTGSGSNLYRVWKDGGRFVAELVEINILPPDSYTRVGIANSFDDALDIIRRHSGRQIKSVGPW
jgi:hypothetical protein